METHEPEREPEREQEPALSPLYGHDDLSRAGQLRILPRLGLLLPGIVRVLEVRRIRDYAPRWEITLADAPGAGDGEVVRGDGPLPHSLRAYLSFQTDDLALVQQLRPRRLRLAVDVLEIIRQGPESGMHSIAGESS
jgi:hypothetical protein